MPVADDVMKGGLLVLVLLLALNPYLEMNNLLRIRFHFAHNNLV
jgi:hypothetical protein